MNILESFPVVVATPFIIFDMSEQTEPKGYICTYNGDANIFPGIGMTTNF